MTAGDNGARLDRQDDAAIGRRAAWRSAAAIAGFVVFAAALALWRPPDLMLWIKALHVIAIIAWMAGLLYLPRLYVYHSDTAPGSPQWQTFVVMERRLLKGIMNPAMMISWLLGLWLIIGVYGMPPAWLWLKLAGVAALTGFHVYLGRARRVFAAGHPCRTARHWRLVNEIPTLLMAAIVVLVIVRPF